jgi:hypothetical protein
MTIFARWDRLATPDVPVGMTTNHTSRFRPQDYSARMIHFTRIAAAGGTSRAAR